MAEEETQEDSDNQTTIDSLPHKSLEKIIQYLPLLDRLRAGQVCRKWREASRNAWKDIEILRIVGRVYGRDGYVLRNSIVIEDNKLQITTDDMKIIHLLVSRVGEHIKKIIFNQPKEETCVAIVSIITEYCRNIEIMELETVHDSCAEKLQELFEVNKKLNSIHCNRSPEILKILPMRDWRTLRIASPCYEECEAQIISLIKNSKSLEAFESLHWSLDITLAIVECRQLKILHFLPCHCAESVQFIYDVPMLNRLTCLSISVYDYDRTVLNDLLKECFNLKDLWLYYLDSRLPDKITETVLSLPQLESLAIGGNLTFNGFVPFAKFKHLALLCEHRLLSDEEISEIVNNSEHLESLDLHDADFSIKLFEDLVRDTRERRKILTVRVYRSFYEDASKICEGSNIRIV